MLKSQLGVRSARLSSMSYFACKALRGQYNVYSPTYINKSIHAANSNTSSTAANINVNAVHAKVHNALSKIVDMQGFIGVSIACIKSQKVIVNSSAGSLGLLDPRDLTPDAYFNLFGISIGVVCLSINMLVCKGEVDVTKPIAHYWKDFCGDGKDMITVEDLLRFRTGFEWYVCCMGAYICNVFIASSLSLSVSLNIKISEPSDYVHLHHCPYPIADIYIPHI